MPHHSSVVFIAAHGTASAKPTTTPIKHYNVICLTSAGLSLQLVSHNLVLGMLLRYAGSADGLYEHLELIESLPSTVCVNASYRPDPATLLSPPPLDLTDSTNRKQLMEHIKKVQHLAINSQKSWELLEHTLRPAEDVLHLPTALSPASSPHWFSGFTKEMTLVSQQFVADPTTTILKICGGRNLIESTISSSEASGSVVLEHHTNTATFPPTDLVIHKCKISSDQVIRVTPHTTAAVHSPLLLSRVLADLSEAHLLVERNQTTPTQFKTVGWYHTNILTPDYYIGQFAHWMTPDVTIYDLTIADDTNVVLGTCRGLDDSI